MAAPAVTELALAARLYNVLACGHERLAYNVSGTFALWARGPGGKGWQPVEGAERVPRDEWRPCIEVRPDGTTSPRRLNPWVIASHVRGRGSVAPNAPSWGGVLAFDLDAHIGREVLADGSDDVIPLEAVRRALRERDRVLAELWRALRWGSGFEPIIGLSPGQGFHVLAPLTRGPDSPSEHTWPGHVIVERTCEVLQRRGVVLAPGRLELYPSGRPLRAPCGLGWVLLRATRPDTPDDLGLEPVPGTTATRRRRVGGEDVGVEVVRRPWVMVEQFLAQWEAARRPLGVWLGEPEIAWSPVRGPFACPDRSLLEAPFVEKIGAVDQGGLSRSQHIGEVQGSPGGCSPAVVGSKGTRSRLRVGQGRDPSGSDPLSTSIPPPTSGASSSLASSRSPKLRQGGEFRAYLRQLLVQGVVTPSSRHDAVLSLVFWWHVSGKAEGELRAELEAWARAHPHVSRLKGERLVRTCVREGMHYYHRIKRLPQRARSLAATVARTRPLAPADLLVLAKVREDVREEAWAILEYLHGHAEDGGRVARTVTLGRTQLDALVVSDRRVPIGGTGRHRAEVVAVRELERLGVVTLYCDYSTGCHGRIFCCWYEFGSGMLPMPREPGGMVGSAAPAPTVAGSEVLVLGERRIREGTLRVLSDGTRRAPWAELEPGSGIVIEQGGGASWWRTMFERRQFTPGEVYAADEAVMLAGPWSRAPRAPVPRRYGELVEELLDLPRRSGGAYDPALPAPEIAAAALPEPPIDPRAELAAELGADVAQLGDFDPELAAIAARALRAVDRRR